MVVVVCVIVDTSVPSAPSGFAEAAVASVEGRDDDDLAAAASGVVVTADLMAESMTRVWEERRIGCGITVCKRSQEAGAVVQAPERR